MTASPDPHVGLPSEEEIARAIYEKHCEEYRAEPWWDDEPDEIKRLHRSQARAILSLIRPAFEAKERECQMVCDSYAEENQRLHDRALSAEAKLAQAVEALTAIETYVDAIVCYASTISEHDGNRVASLVRSASAAATGETR